MPEGSGANGLAVEAEGLERRFKGDIRAVDGVDRLTGRLAALALPLVAVQIGIGEYQYRHGLPWEVVVFHVTTAALVWAVILAACHGVARPVRAPDHLSRDATLWQGTQRTASGSARNLPSGISAPQSTQTP